MTKAEIDEARILSQALAEDAMADDASAHTVVITDVLEPAGTSEPSAEHRQRPADLEEEGKKITAPPLRRDSTLTIPSPTARDAEVMQSNQARPVMRAIFGVEQIRKGLPW